jgi:uncharacterized protein (DUF4213/DUF364 family)
MTACPIATRIVACLSTAAREVQVADVRIGLGYTAVQLADGRAGVAYTFRDLARGGCSVFSGCRPLRGRAAWDLLSLLESTDPIEAGVGLACANALANSHDSGQLEGDVLQHLVIAPDHDVAMVGHFGPLVETLRQRARTLTIFERVAAPTDLLRPQEEAAAALPRCQIALITATALITHALDDLLEAARSCRQVVILGASTPLLVEPFAATAVTMLSGVVVTAPGDVLQVVSEGGGMRQFGPLVRKLNVKLGSQRPGTGGP